MELFLNSCDIDEIVEIYDWGILDGVTMNPTMLASAGGEFQDRLREICRRVPAKVFVQAVSRDAATLVEEAKRLRAFGDNVVVKIHTGVEGIKAITRLKSSTDIPVCATAIHSAIEAVAAARAGADHAAVFLGLLGEVDERPVSDLIEAVVQTIRACRQDMQIMTAARSLQQIVAGFRTGADEMTCSYKLWQLFLSNQHTRDRWDAFSSDWRTAFGSRSWIRP